jgi:hypothetical protein
MAHRNRHHLIAHAAACAAVLLAAASPAFGQGRFELTFKAFEPGEPNSRACRDR